MAEPTPAERPETTPLASGIFSYFRFDLLAGFLVFLIAMPLCLAIAKASNYPPIAGIWTAVIGGIVCTMLSNSELTIKGPAAGLIVIVSGAVIELGKALGSDLPEAEQLMLGYRLALGIGVVAGILQIIFGICRAGKLADLFPLTPVHGMLASIGIVIIVKSYYDVIGVSPIKGASLFALIGQSPGATMGLNSEIALIGLGSLAILFAWPWIPIKFIQRVPPQVVVLVLAVGLAWHYGLADNFLVNMPNVLENPSSAFAFPEFAGLTTWVGVKYLILFSLIGSLESLLSAKAIELIDPWKRKTNHNRDMIAIGVANTLCSCVGALPMISEIVRSVANIGNGARTRMANLYHGIFLLVAALFMATFIRMIPLAALAAMLVYTGFRLASPREFVRTYKIGVEQFIVFVGTIAATLATDLLVGIATGVVMEIAFHLWHGVPIRRLFSSDIEVLPAENGTSVAVVIVKQAAVFSNWLGVRNTIFVEAEGRNEVVVDLADTHYVDHSVMEKLHEMEKAFADMGKKLTVRGLESHVPSSQHPQAARKRARMEAVLTK